MMRRILMLLTVVAMMVAMMVVMAGTAAAQPTELGPCLKQSGKFGTVIELPSPGEEFRCIGKPPF
jgi:hypothetical protein